MIVDELLHRYRRDHTVTRVDAEDGVIGLARLHGFAVER
jgi:hypothetical protein